jgi:hypothetical protein
MRAAGTAKVNLLAIHGTAFELTNAGAAAFYARQSGCVQGDNRPDRLLQDFFVKLCLPEPCFQGEK